MSVLEAFVPARKWVMLKAEFRHSTELLPPQICETILIQSIEDPTLWKVITIWHQKRHIKRLQDVMLRCGAAEIFRSIGVEPRQGLFNIMMTAQETDLGSDLAETPLSDMLMAVEDTP